ncbi:hypothetical protein MVES1_002474 [Malassezia vespertilionis]|uniref:Reb1p n=1 Tax=Malassezia vespertilionis TaxID=2020962 RepID=A0A2N1JAQ4_9BASI|nr:uncharacterized protein MVES1_002474 [Malassezia vespertilionis]PKI83635.1 Reb1p [Malassezia vespertilionis]WFD07117.1 hypothetical protein MVES1_002474 [Malassezia vespertilionis]
MEQRANRARNALLSGAPDAGTNGAPGWPNEQWSTSAILELAYDASDPSARPAAVPSESTEREPNASRPALGGDNGIVDTISSALENSGPLFTLDDRGKRRAIHDASPSKRVRAHDSLDVESRHGIDPALDVREDAYAGPFDAVHTLGSQFVAHDAGLPFDIAPRYDEAAANTVMQVATPADAQITQRRLQRRDDTGKKLKPTQEKARAAFVTAHAGQTYEQMVLERAYSSDRLYWLKEAYGLSWRTGRWSQEEEDLATAALDKFCKHYKLSPAALDELIWHRKPEQKHLHEELWKHIALSVGTRPNYAVRMHIKSMRKDVVRGGNWSASEVEALAAAVAELGRQWEKIGARLGRSGNVCKHYWREQMQNSHPASIPLGAFRPEEEVALRRAVLECCERVGCRPDGPNLPWTLIHERLGPSTRRISVLSRKWRGMLSAERRNLEDQNARWYAPHDDHILIQRIRAQGKLHVADVEFDKLATDDWQWPTYVVKKHWTVMYRKRAPPDFQGTLDELLDMLDSRVPSPNEYKLLASGRRPAKSPPIESYTDAGP